MVSFAEAVEAISGWNTSLYELMELGERTITLARMSNIREGLCSKALLAPSLKPLQACFKKV